MSESGTFETSRGYAWSSGFGGQADVERKHPEDRVSPMALIKSAMRALCLLLAEAGNLLWHFIVQREACGLRDSARVMQDYGVPNDVRVRMGVFPNRRR